MRVSKYLRGRQVSKRASPGERVMGSLFTPNLYGWGGWGSDDLYEQVQHYRQWTYVALHAICRKIASLTPNFCYVSDHEVPGHTVKACQRGLFNVMGKGFGGSGLVGDDVVLSSSIADPKSTYTKQYESPNYASKWEPGATCSGGGSFLTMGEYRSKALSVLKPHEHIEPLEHDHPLRRLWDNPNPYDTSFDFAYELCMFHHLCGSAYPWMVPNSMPDPKPAELWVMPSHWVWPRTGGGNIVAGEPGNGNAAFNSQHGEWWRDSDRIIKYYEVRPWGTTGTAGMLKIPPSDMCMVKWKSPLDKVRGYSPLGAIAQWIDSEESITKSRWAQFQNIARPDLFIQLGAGYEDATDDQIERTSAKIDQKLRGEYNYGRTMIGTPGMTVTPLSFNPTEMAYGSSEELIRDQILSAMGVPKSWVGISDSMTFGAILATLMQASEGCINPYLSMLGQALTKHLASRWDESHSAWSTLTGKGYGANSSTRYVKMFWDNTTPADPAQVNSDLQTDAMFKALTPNELRAMRGRPPYKHGGDDPMGAAGDVPIPLNTGDDLEDLAKLMAPMENPKQNLEAASEATEEGVDVSGSQQGSDSAQEQTDDAMDDATDPGVEEPNGKPAKRWYGNYKPTMRSKSILRQWQKRWVSKQDGPHEFSCVMALLEGEVRERVLTLAAAIADEDLAEKGREDQPHVTVFYGMHTDNATEVRDAVETFGPVQAQLGKIDYFPSDEHDVVIIRVESEDLHLLNEELGQLPNTNKHPEYQPHVTLAFVKPGMGQHYVDDLEGQTFDEQGVEAEEIDVEFTQLVFSPANGTPVAVDIASYAAQEAGALKGVRKNSDVVQALRRYQDAGASLADELNADNWRQVSAKADALKAQVTSLLSSASTSALTEAVGEFGMRATSKSEAVKKLVNMCLATYRSRAANMV